MVALAMKQIKISIATMAKQHKTTHNHKNIPTAILINETPNIKIPVGILIIETEHINIHIRI